MAKMYPEFLPFGVCDDPLYKGEVEVFDELELLTDDYHVFYNRTADDGKTRDAYSKEIDFIIIHEQYGLLAMEVKGGKVRVNEDGTFQQFQPINDKGWSSITPFKQVRDALIKLILKMKSDGANYWIPDNICVCFPKVSRQELTQGRYKIPLGVLCADDLPMLETLLPTFFAKNNTAAWKRENFIDMRRRLQSAPMREQTSGYSSRYEREKRIPVDKQNTNYMRSKHSKAKQSKRIKMWEVCVLVAGAVSAFMIVSYFLPHSIIYQLLRSQP